MDWAALKRKFNFTVSAITTVGVDLAIPHRIGQKITSIAESERHHFELSGIVVFPIIADPNVYVRADFLSHKRSSNGYFVGHNIDFQLWRRSRTPGRVKLTVENFRASIKAIPERHLSEPSKARLLAMLEAAAEGVRHEA